MRGARFSVLLVDLFQSFQSSTLRTPDKQGAADSIAPRIPPALVAGAQAGCRCFVWLCGWFVMFWLVVLLVVFSSSLLILSSSLSFFFSSSLLILFSSSLHLLFFSSVPLLLLSSPLILFFSSALLLLFLSPAFLLLFSCCRLFFPLLPFFCSVVCSSCF